MKKPIKVKSFECNFNHETGLFSFQLILKPYRQKEIGLVGKNIPSKLVHWQAISPP